MCDWRRGETLNLFATLGVEENSVVAGRALALDETGVEPVLSTGRVPAANSMDCAPVAPLDPTRDMPGTLPAACAVADTCKTGRDSTRFLAHEPSKRPSR